MDKRREESEMNKPDIGELFVRATVAIGLFCVRLVVHEVEIFG
jgi:hypothetical protein